MATSRMRIAPVLTLSPQAVTDTYAILGRRGSGKTATASVMAEEMLEAGRRLFVIDPVGVWWGMRACDGADPVLRSRADAEAAAVAALARGRRGPTR